MQQASRTVSEIPSSDYGNRKIVVHRMLLRCQGTGRQPVSAERFPATYLAGTDASPSGDTGRLR